MASIFLSYAVSDELFVSRLANELKCLGHQILHDCITCFPEKTFLAQLLSAQKQIDFIMLVFSASSGRGTMISDFYWNGCIIDEAIHGRNWLIPIWLEDSNLPRGIFPNKIKDFRDSSFYSLAFENLVTSLVRSPIVHL